jgi:hypothetical protein
MVAHCHRAAAVPPVNQDGVYNATPELAGKLEKYMKRRTQSRQSIAGQLLHISEVVLDYAGLITPARFILDIHILTEQMHHGRKIGKKATNAQRCANRAILRGRSLRANASLHSKVRVADALEVNASVNVLWVGLLNLEQGMSPIELR